MPTRFILRRSGPLTCLCTPSAVPGRIKPASCRNARYTYLSGGEETADKDRTHKVVPLQLVAKKEKRIGLPAVTRRRKKHQNMNNTESCVPQHNGHSKRTGNRQKKHTPAEQVGTHLNVQHIPGVMGTPLGLVTRTRERCLPTLARGNR